MNTGPVKSWVDRLLEMALALVAIGLLLQWAWQLIRPLVPVLVVGSGLVVTATTVRKRHRQW